MPSWYLFSIAALLLLGSQRFLYKVAAERNYPSSQISAVFMGTVALLSGAVFLVSGKPVGEPGPLILLALINSSAFAVATMAHMEALRHLPAGITFPLTRLSILVVIGVSIFYFGDQPDPGQWFGILLGGAVVIILTREAGRAALPHGRAATGLALIALCILCGAAATVSSKLAAVQTSKTGFMTLSYLLGTLFSLAIGRLRRPAGTTPIGSGAWKLGIPMGLLNFCGFYAFLTALETGPLSVIALITGMHFVIAIVLSMLFYHEALTRRRLAGLILTLVALVFLQH